MEARFLLKSATRRSYQLLPMSTLQSKWINYLDCYCRVVQRFYEEMKNSKNTWVHAKLANFLYLILEYYPYEQTFERPVSAIQQGTMQMIQILEQYTQLALTDANPEARQRGRRAFLSWHSQSPNHADNLYKVLEYQVQKAIMEEKENPSASFINDTTTVDTGSHSMISRSILSQGSAANTHLNNSYGAVAKKKGSTPLAQEIEGFNKSAGRPQTTAQNNQVRTTKA